MRRLTPHLCHLLSANQFFDTLKRPGNSRASCHAVNILLCPQSRAADINGAGAQLSLHTGSQPMASITRRTTALTTYS